MFDYFKCTPIQKIKMITNPPLLQTYHLQIKVDSTLIQKGSIQEKKWKKKTEERKTDQDTES